MIFNDSFINIDGHNARFRSFIPDVAEGSYADKFKEARPAVVILPGGGYAYTSPREAEPIALELCAKGICSFILDYAVADSGKVFPVALAEALTAVKYVRDNAKEFCIDKDNISTLGFSAGGHLCACTGTLWNSPVLNGFLDGNRKAYRPDKMILCYPVISAEPFAHKGSFENLLGKKFDEITDDERKLVSLEKQVGVHTPPTFIWSTTEDNGVPIRNSTAMADALAANGIPMEIHIYPHGHHGLSTGNNVTCDVPFGSDYDCADWMQKAVKFIYDKFDKK